MVTTLLLMQLLGVQGMVLLLEQWYVEQWEEHWEVLWVLWLALPCAEQLVEVLVLQ